MDPLRLIRRRAGALGQPAAAAARSRAANPSASRTARARAPDPTAAAAARTRAPDPTGTGAARSRPADPTPSGWSGAPPAASLILLVLVGVFCATTHWGRNYPIFARKSWITWSEGRALPLEQRRQMLYDQTYPVLVYMRDNTPPDAVILLPPQTFIEEKLADPARPGDVPLLASPSSVYNFIYPRVPVHWGDPSPYKNRVTWVLVWEHWGLDLVDPGAPRTADNEIALYPWPQGRSPSW